MKCNQSRIWTRVAVYNSCDDNHYTTGTSKNSSWLVPLKFDITRLKKTEALWVFATMWAVRQADDPFVCFGEKPNTGLGLEISDETRSGEERQVREKPVAQLAKEPREGKLAKRDAERQSRTDSRRDQSRWVCRLEWTTVSRRRQWGRRSKISWISLLASVIVSRKMHSQR